MMPGPSSSQPIATAASLTASPQLDPPVQPRTAAPAAPSVVKPASTSTGRLLSLDMLRGIAIVLVIGRHTVAEPEGLGVFGPVARAWMDIGWSGVDLFFVLSGFLVSGLLFSEYRRNGQVDIRRFIIRRGFKIWPPYLFYLGFVACWLAWKMRHDPAGSVLEALWPNFLHVQNYFHTPRVHTWSLAVEEHFYLIVALGFAWVLARGHAERWLRVFPWFVAATVVALAGLRSFAYWHEGPDHMNLYATHLRFDGLLLGTLLAYFTHFAPEKLAPLTRHPTALLFAGAALAAPVLYATPEANLWMAGPGLTGLYVGYALIVLGWVNLGPMTRWGRRMFATAPAAWLGAIGFYSYSIYLWHVDLAQTPMHKVALALSARHVPAGLVWVGVTAVYAALAFVFGRLLARVLEVPSLALRDRLFPSTVKAVAPTVSAR